MGCFNMKCALTQLPVRHGDAVVMLIGVKPGNDDLPYSGGYLYQPMFLKLLTTPLYGQYNDYGWLDCIDKDSIKAASQMLEAQGLGKAIKKGLKGEHWDECLEAFTKTYNEQYPDGLMLTHATYTFVHRKAWDNLVEYGRQAMGSFSVNNISDTDLATVQHALPSFGFIKPEVSKYGERKVYSTYGTPVQFFRAALAMLPHQLPATTVTEKPVYGKNLTQEELAEAMAALEEYHAQLEAARRAKLPSNLGVWFSRSFTWFKTLLTTKDNYDHLYPVRELMLSVLDAACKREVLAQQLEDTAVVYNALLENQLVIRAYDDMPSQSQESTYWGHIAIVKAAAEIIHARAENHISAEARTPGTDPRAVVEQLAQEELKSLY